MIGYLNLETVKNISNIPTFQIVSSNDNVFTGREHEGEQILEPYGNYTQYNLVGMPHTQMSVYAANARILNKLLKNRRNLWPEHILFKTIRNRHLKSFGVTLHGISFGELETYIQADWKIVPQSLISIEMHGSTGVTVSIPPQIDRKQFTVQINGYELQLKDFERKELILPEEHGIWKILEQAPKVNFRKGSGILDVYMDSMRIVIPADANETVRQVASVLAHPKSNGMNPNIDVDYPVYDPFTFPADLFDHNIILLDCCSTNFCLEEISENFKFQCNFNAMVLDLNIRDTDTKVNMLLGKRLSV